jgi:hypothetical protein
MSQGIISQNPTSMDYLIMMLRFSPYSIFFVPIINVDHYYIRIINKNAIAEFQLQLSWERWEDVFGENDVNSMFNNFLNTYLRYYHSSFIKKESRHQRINKQWPTKGIKISCNRKK